jgi:hypothetical protein
MVSKAKTFMIEDADIIMPLRNFSGKERKYNKEGDRNFIIRLPEDLATQMLDDGWNVKYLKPNEVGDDPTPIIAVKVKYDIRPPRVVLISSTGPTNLSEDMVEILDWAEILTADLIARGSDWVRNGESGTTAYLQTLVVTIEEDALERKYGINRE